jgi:hypothetical protein
MRAAALQRRDVLPANAAAGLPRRAAGLHDVSSLASAVGNRAFARHIARCAGSSRAEAARRSGQPCCEECAAAEQALASAVQARQTANHDSPARDKEAKKPDGEKKPDGAKKPEAPACPPANSTKKAKIKLQPVLIADDDGKNPTTAPAMAKVAEIWKKCCIDIEVVASKTIKKRDYKTLDESPDDKPTDEEKKMFGDGGQFDGVQVYVPVEFTMGGDTGKDVNGGGATYDAGKEHPKVVVVEGALPEVVAHEVGHATGHLTHDESDTVMKPTGKHDTANKTAVSAAVCASARNGKIIVAGADACCMDPK